MQWPGGRDPGAGRGEEGGGGGAQKSKRAAESREGEVGRGKGGLQTGMVCGMCVCVCVQFSMCMCIFVGKGMKCGMEYIYIIMIVDAIRVCIANLLINIPFEAKVPLIRLLVLQIC